MTDAPLYCPCGTRLGFRRSDGAFASRHTGRTYVFYEAFVSMDVVNAAFEITCETCARTTNYAALLDKPPVEG